MDMFEAEFARLVREQHEKQPYTTTSLEQERQELLEIYYDHVVAVQSFTSEEVSVGAAQGPVPGVHERRTHADRVNAQIAELMRGEAGAQWTVEGEKHVSGHGIYLCPDEDGSAYILDEGHVLIGTSNSAAVMEVVPYSAYQAVQEKDDFSAEGEEYNGESTSSVCLVLTQVKRYDASGEVFGEHIEVFVPLTYKSLKFAAVERQPLIVIGGGETPTVSTYSLLSGNDFRQACLDIENDLTYGDYDPQTFKQQYMEHLEDLREQMQFVDHDAVMVVSGEGEDIAHNSVTLVEATAYYCGATILQQADTWRVAHGFSVDDELVHILPEDLISAEVCDE